MATKKTIPKTTSKIPLNLPALASLVIGILLVIAFIVPVSWSISSIFYTTGYSFSLTSLFYGVLLSVYLLSAIAFSLLLVKLGLLSLEKKLAKFVFAPSVLVLAISLIISSMGINDILSSLYYSYSFPLSPILNATNLVVAILLILELAIGALSILASFIRRARGSDKYDYFSILLPFVFATALFWSSTPNTLESSFGIIVYLVSAAAIIITLIKKTQESA